MIQVLRKSWLTPTTATFYLRVTKTRTRSSVFSLSFFFFPMWIANIDSPGYISPAVSMRSAARQVEEEGGEEGRQEKGPGSLGTPPSCPPVLCISCLFANSSAQSRALILPPDAVSDASYFSSGAQAGQSLDVLRPPKPPSLDPLFLCYSYGTLEMCFQRFTPYQEFQERKVKKWWLRFY